MEAQDQPWMILLLIIVLDASIIKHYNIKNSEWNSFLKYTKISQNKIQIFQKLKYLKVKTYSSTYEGNQHKKF